MCRTRKEVLVVDPAMRRPRPASAASTTTLPSLPPSPAPTRTSFPAMSSDDDRTAPATPWPPSTSSKPSSSSASSAGLREVLPPPPNLYDFSEICSATNNFLGKRLPSSTSNSWRCTLRGKDVVVFQRRFRGVRRTLPRRLAALARIHHTSIVPLLGVALGGDYIYLVYEYVNGASLAECLRNPHNPGFTPLAAWVDRLQVAADLAQGLQYIHHFTDAGTAAPSPASNKTDARTAIACPRRPVHNRIKSSSVMVTEDQRRAKICHFGAAELAGEISTSSDSDVGAYKDDEEVSESPPATPRPTLQRRSGGGKRFEGTRGYIAPELHEGGSPSQKSDVFNFGVVLLELLTGEEPQKYRYDREKNRYEMVSLIEMARAILGREEENQGQGKKEVGLTEEEGHRRLRRWVDRRLKDSFPVEVAEKTARLALECVRREAEMRPDMVRVAGKLSRLLLKSKTWAEKRRVPGEITVSMAPR